MLSRKQSSSAKQLESAVTATAVAAAVHIAAVEQQRDESIAAMKKAEEANASAQTELERLRSELASALEDREAAVATAEEAVGHCSPQNTVEGPLQSPGAAGSTQQVAMNARAVSARELTLQQELNQERAAVRELESKLSELKREGETSSENDQRSTAVQVTEQLKFERARMERVVADLHREREQVVCDHANRAFELQQSSHQLEQENREYKLLLSNMEMSAEASSLELKEFKLKLRAVEETHSHAQSSHDCLLMTEAEAERREALRVSLHTLKYILGGFLLECQHVQQFRALVDWKLRMARRIGGGNISPRSPRIGQLPAAQIEDALDVVREALRVKEQEMEAQKAVHQVELSELMKVKSALFVQVCSVYRSFLFWFLSLGRI